MTIFTISAMPPKKKPLFKRLAATEPTNANKQNPAKRKIHSQGFSAGTGYLKDIHGNRSDHYGQLIKRRRKQTSTPSQPPSLPPTPRHEQTSTPSQPPSLPPTPRHEQTSTPSQPPSLTSTPRHEQTSTPSQPPSLTSTPRHEHTKPAPLLGTDETVHLVNVSKHSEPPPDPIPCSVQGRESMTEQPVLMEVHPPVSKIEKNTLGSDETAGVVSPSNATTKETCSQDSAKTSLSLTVSQQMMDEALFGSTASYPCCSDVIKIDTVTESTAKGTVQECDEVKDKGSIPGVNMKALDVIPTQTIPSEVPDLIIYPDPHYPESGSDCCVAQQTTEQGPKDGMPSRDTADYDEQFYLEGMDTDDLLCGICPEDLSFSFNNSTYMEPTRTPCKTELTVTPAIFKDSTVTNHIKRQTGDGTFYGLPAKVKECLKEHRGITQLYEWQDACLHLPSVVNGTNLIYSLPTSGGKTLVAEIIILKQLLLKNKDVLLILPFVSIVQEKVRQLNPFSSTLGFAVEEYAASKGRLPPRRRRKKRVIYIATIEKANGLVNSLIELDRIGSLGLVVVDELHMLGDGSIRGATLESCLAKLQHCSKDTQLVGMSATLSNINELATFMRAQVYSSDFRPVELVEQVKLGRCVYSVSVETGGLVNLDPVRDVRDPAHSQLDPDQLTSLVMEVVPNSSCLVFCPTKKNCQNVALLLTKSLPSSLKLVKQAAKRQLLKLLSVEASGVCPILSQTIPYGLAYHHSGLTADERRVMEEGYLEGVLCLIACTSTLAAGVNLPAKRVILRSPYVGNQFITRSQYKQMVGRAGRSGLCDRGESILISSPEDKEKVISLLSGPYDSCHSSLLTGNGEALLSLVLNVIGLKQVRRYSELCAFFQSTLLYVQRDHTHLDKCCQDSVGRLVSMGYVTMETGDDPTDSTYMITSLGRAAFKGCLPIGQAHQIYSELMKGQQRLILSTELQLLFLATPTDLCTSIRPNWMVYFEVLTGLGVDELAVAELLEVKPGYLAGRATGSTSGSTPPATLQLYHRFYISLILHSLLKLTSPEAIWKVAERFHCSRGFLQSIMNTTASHASCLVHFTGELPELWSLHLLLPAISKRLSYFSSLDLVPLMEVSGVKQGRARQLLSAGITTPHQLVNSDPHSLCDMVDNLFPKQATRLIQAAKALLTDQAEALMEEAEELMLAQVQHS